MGQKVRIGLVGGGFARAFPFAEHPDGVVAAIADPRPDRLAALRDRTKCDNTYATLEELLRDPTVEAVGLFTPAPLHAQHSIAALRAGKHVLSAVPAAMTLEECRELLDTVRSTG